MITTLKDNAGRVIAYMEWRQVGQSGFDKLHGKYIYVAYAWVHKDFRKTKRLELLISEVMILAPDAEFGYYLSKKHHERKTMFIRSKWERRSVIYDPLITKEISYG